MNNVGVGYKTLESGALSKLPLFIHDVSIITENYNKIIQDNKKFTSSKL